MPKKKAKKKTGVRRKRRVGASASGDLMQLAIGALAGNIVGPLVVNMVASKVASSMDPKLVKFGGAGLQAFAGYMAATKLKSPLAKGFGIGLIGAGGRTALSAVVPALGALPVLIPQRSSGIVGNNYGVQRRVAGVTPNGGFPRPSTVGSAQAQGRVSNMAAVYAAGGM